MLFSLRLVAALLNPLHLRDDAPPVYGESHYFLQGGGPPSIVTPVLDSQEGIISWCPSWIARPHEGQSDGASSPDVVSINVVVHFKY